MNIEIQKEFYHEAWRSFFADLSPVRGSEQGGVRPVLIVQNNRGNRYSQTIIVAAITSKKMTQLLPTQLFLGKEESGLQRDSIILVEQLRTIDKSRLQEKVCYLTQTKMQEVDQALKVSLGLLVKGGK